MSNNHATSTRNAVILQHNGIFLVERRAFLIVVDRFFNDSFQIEERSNKLLLSTIQTMYTEDGMEEGHLVWQFSVPLLHIDTIGWRAYPTLIRGDYLLNFGAVENPKIIKSNWANKSIRTAKRHLSGLEVDFLWDDFNYSLEVVADVLHGCRFETVRDHMNVILGYQLRSGDHQTLDMSIEPPIDIPVNPPGK